MGKILVIAEKPSVGRDIARVLKCDKKGDGFVYGEGYIVSWAIGHLVTLFEPEDYGEQYKKWRMETLPVIPEVIQLKGIAKTKSQLLTLKKLMNSPDVDSLICATDSGREGELIFRYIYDIVKCKKPFQRLWISSMTDKAINDGFAKLADGTQYDALYASAKCRSEADWLVGMNATRAYTIRYNTLLSIGRVQTPTLAILVERQKEIDAFVAKDYWEVTAQFAPEHMPETYKGKWFDPANDNETKLDSAEAAEAIVARTKKQAGAVTSVENEEKRMPPPLLYDLTELQRDCNRKFGFAASKTLTIAQELYEKRKMITYPRTDSRYVSDDMIGKLNATMRKLAAVSPYSAYAAPLAEGNLPITKRIVDNSKVTDHHAIIPTDGRLNPDALSADERKVFDLVAKRFIAVFMPYYEYNVTKVVTLVGIDSFLSKGTVVTQWGWQALYKDDAPEAEDKPKAKGRKKKTEDDDEDTVLPPLAVGDAATATDVSSEKKATKPPKPYTEATLLSAMENAGRFIEDEDLREQMKDAGLGTPATRAATIERLLQVQYIERKGKALIPTEKGVKLIAIVPAELRSPVTTGKWEKGLSSIAKGGMESERFMGSITRYVHYIIGQAKAADRSITFPPDPKRGGSGGGKAQKVDSLGLCPVCGTGAVLENTKSYYCGRWRDGCKFTIWKDATARNGLALTPELIRQLLAAKKVEKVPMFKPQTQEKCVADIVLKPDLPTRFEIVNMSLLPKKEASGAQAEPAQTTQTTEASYAE